MGIFDFLKKKQEKEKVEEIINIKVDQIDDFIKEEKDKLSKKFEIIRKDLGNLVEELVLNLEESLPYLKQVNLDNKREQEKLKIVVMENFRLYISYLEELIQDLSRLNTQEVNEYIKEVNEIFDRFGKNSRTCFEKATILIGEPLGKVKEKISQFAGNFKRKIQENKETINLIDSIKALKETLDEFKEIGKIENSIKEGILGYEANINVLKNDKQLCEKEIEAYKKTKAYKEFLEQQSELEQEKINLTRDIFNLKEFLDLKFLSKHFHNDTKKSKLIKSYIDNFSETLKNDNLEIIDLCIKAGKDVNKELIIETKNRIINQRTIKDKKFNDLKDNLDKINQYIIDKTRILEHEIDKKQKFYEKEKLIIEKISSQLKSSWNNVNLVS